MAKVTKRNQGLIDSLSAMKPKENLVAANKVPEYNTRNLSGHEAYKLDDELRLISMLNTLKLEPQFYRSSSQQAIELKQLIERCAAKDPYFVAQCIVYSRCLGEGMRTINHLAAVLLAPYAAKFDWGKRFYGLWNKKEKKGGTIFRADDMAEIKLIYDVLNPRNSVESKHQKKSMTNAMKKGFASALQNLDAYSLLKYKTDLIDVINCVHPNVKESRAWVEVDGKKISAIEAIMTGLSVSADTWESAQSEAGKVVSQAIKEGKIDKTEAEKVLKEAKADNWKGLLNDGKLGILAALRNIRSMLTSDVDAPTLDKLCELVSNPQKIRDGKILPFHLELANTVVLNEFSDSRARAISQALLKGFDAAMPNLKEALPGNNLVILDVSGSMCTDIQDSKTHKAYRSSCMEKSALIAATIAKATNADVIQFSTNANYKQYNPNMDVFSIAKSLHASGGCTNLATAWQLAERMGRVYNRVFILSDNECNQGRNKDAYKSYIQKIGNPYVYSIDLASYGTTAISGDRVRYYFGYGYSMFDDIATSEFNPTYHLDKIKKVVI